MNEDQMNELGGVAVEQLLTFLRDGSDEMTDRELRAHMGRARIAASALSSCTRYTQAVRATDAMHFMMARELADDRGQKLQEYMRLTMPESVITKALPIPVPS